MGKFLTTILVMSFGMIVHASELSCITAQSSDGSISKITTGTYTTIFGSVKRTLTIKKIDASSGLEDPRFTHSFSVNSIKKDSQFVQISGIKMVNSGGGIIGMTSFDALSLSINKSTKLGVLRVVPTYSTGQSWSLKFTCSSLPSL